MRPRPAAGLLLLFSAFGLFWKGVNYLRTRPKSMAPRDTARARRELLGARSLDEKEVLAMYVRARARTLQFDLRDGVVAALENEGILDRTTAVGKLASFPYTLRPWAWKLLMDEPSLIAPTSEERALLGERPMRAARGRRLTADEAFEATFPFLLKPSGPATGRKK